MEREAKEKGPGARELQKAQTRAALLAAAKRVFVKRGFAAATTREIAAEADVAAGTFFVHFPSLGALVSVLLDEHVEKVLARGLGAAAKKQGVVAQLVHASKVLFDSYDEAPELARAFITGSLFPSAQGAGQLTSTRLATYRAWVVERIDDAIRSGELREIDRELAFSSFFSIYFGLLVSGLNGQLTRKRQLALLQAALTRLFLLEAS
jgi:AcrR family transcriptional regulator